MLAHSLIVVRRSLAPTGPGTFGLFTENFLVTILRLVQVGREALDEVPAR